MPCFCFKCNFKSYFQLQANIQYEQWYCTAAAALIGCCNFGVAFVPIKFSDWADSGLLAAAKAAAIALATETASNAVPVMLFVVAVVVDNDAQQSLHSPSMRRRQHLNSLRIVTSGSKIVAADVRRRRREGAVIVKSIESENQTQPNVN